MKRRSEIAARLARINSYIVYLVIVIVVFDVVILHNIFGFGYTRDRDQDYYQRVPAPYVGFTGMPSVVYANTPHNEYGFRGSSFKESKPNDLKIAFFGGSTGYHGDPPIPNIIENALERLLRKSVFVANYSVVSSNHRQHLHGIIEFLPQFKPDLIIFYGGYNETISHARRDPRPGYPYNFFYRSETRPFFKLLLENSAIIGEIDKRIGVFNGLRKLRKEQQPYSDGWNNRIVDKYFETLTLANNVAGSLESKYFGQTRFLAFYQPYQVPDIFIPAHNKIKERISTTKNVIDVSSEYDALGKLIYRDIAHVNQQAKEVMGEKIAEIIAKELF